jgi:hypothetical protein
VGTPRRASWPSSRRRAAAKARPSGLGEALAASSDACAACGLDGVAGLDVGGSGAVVVMVVDVAVIVVGVIDTVDVVIVAVDVDVNVVVDGWANTGLGAIRIAQMLPDRGPPVSGGASRRP